MNQIYTTLVSRIDGNPAEFGRVFLAAVPRVGELVHHNRKRYEVLGMAHIASDYYTTSTDGMTGEPAVKLWVKENA